MVDSDQRGLQWISTEQSSGGQSEYMFSERIGPSQLQQPSKSSSDGPFVTKALSVAGTAFLSVVLVNPLDVAKTRLQTQVAGAPYCHPLANVTSRMAFFGPTMQEKLRLTIHQPRASLWMKTRIQSGSEFD